MTNSPLPSFLTSSFPEYKSPPPPRLQSLYSDIHKQKQTNAEGFRSSIAWWTNVLETVVKAGKQPQSNDSLVLHANDALVEGLRWEKVGRPIGVGAVVEELTSSASLFPLGDFLKSTTSIYYQPGVAFRIASYLLAKPLWWALSQLSLTGDNTSLSSEERWKRFKGDYVVHSLLKAAGDVVIAHQAEKTLGLAECLYSRDSFRSEFQSVVSRIAPLSDLDVDVLLKYLERDRRVITRQGQIIKFVDPNDPEALIEGVTEVDRGVLEMKSTLKMLDDQINEIERQIQERLDKIRDLLRSGSKTRAFTYLRSKKQLEEVLSKRLTSQETLQNMLLKIEGAVTDAEIMKAYDTSAKTLRSVLKHPLLQMSSIEQTMENMSEALADHKEIEDAISLGNEDAQRAAGVVEPDESELADELAALVEEQVQEQREQEAVRKAQEDKAKVDKIPSLPAALSGAVSPPISTPVRQANGAAAQNPDRSTQTAMRTDQDQKDDSLETAT